jgi:ketosteroid isomerase-like protein
MLKASVLALALVATSATAAAAQQPTVSQSLPSIQLPAALDRVLRDYEAAWAAGDEAALAALFTEDGFVPTPSGWVRGREAIMRVYANSSGSLRLRAIAYSVSDNAGYIVGAYTYGDPAGADGGKFLLAIRRDDSGKWLIAADLDSSNRR